MIQDSQGEIMELSKPFKIIFQNAVNDVSADFILSIMLFIEKLQ